VVWTKTTFHKRKQLSCAI